MINSIAERLANFLVDFPPFSQLSQSELVDISNDIRVLSLEKNIALFKINDVLHDCFYVVASGAINLSVIADAEENLLNKCIVGDVFGLRPFFAKNNYMMTAKSLEESIVYAIPIATFRPFVANNAAVLDFLLQSFASTAQNPNEKNGKGKLLNDNVQYVDNQVEIQFFQSLNYNIKPLIVVRTQTVQSVAQAMSDNLYGCAIIQQNNHPIGIVTDEDLRSKIATGRFSIATLVENIMTTPVITVPENISLAEAQLLMLRFNVSFLCVTTTGTDKSTIKGIISQQDIIAAQSNNPGILIKEIKTAKTVQDLKILREKLAEFIRISIVKKILLSQIFAIASEVNSAVIKRATELGILELGSAPSRFSILSIGSQGRKEQLLLTEQNHILIFEDVAADNHKSTKEYYLRLAQIITNSLQSIGFESSKKEYVSSNYIYCNTLTDWKQQYANWINTPGEKTDSVDGVFFDLDCVFGEIKIEEIILDYIFETIKNKKKFFAFLANDAIKKPLPLGFFKQFNVEEDGQFKDFFDVKTKALNYFIDTARVLALYNEIKGINNTYLRFKQLAINDIKNSEVYLTAAESFLTISRLRTIDGLKNNSNGQFINIEELSKSDKEQLKSAFNCMKDIEDIIKSKFSLTYFS